MPRRVSGQACLLMVTAMNQQIEIERGGWKGGTPPQNKHVCKYAVAVKQILHMTEVYDPRYFFVQGRNATAVFFRFRYELDFCRQRKQQQQQWGDLDLPNSVGLKNIQILL